MDLLVNRAALSSLRTLTGQDFGLNIREWVSWKTRTAALFASQSPYVYPVFNRDRHWYEWVVPFLQPPNEVASTPAGMPDPFSSGSGDSTHTPEPNIRNN